MSNENTTTPTTEDADGEAVRPDTPSGPEDDTSAHGIIRRISDAGTDDDTEGNRLK